MYAECVYIYIYVYIYVYIHICSMAAFVLASGHTWESSCGPADTLDGAQVKPERARGFLGKGTNVDTCRCCHFMLVTEKIRMPPSWISQGQVKLSSLPPDAGTPFGHSCGATKPSVKLSRPPTPKCCQNLSGTYPPRSHGRLVCR